MHFIQNRFIDLHSPCVAQWCTSTDAHIILPRITSHDQIKGQFRHAILGQDSTRGNKGPQCLTQGNVWGNQQINMIVSNRDKNGMCSMSSRYLINIAKVGYPVEFAIKKTQKNTCGNRKKGMGATNEIRQQQSHHHHQIIISHQNSIIPSSPYRHIATSRQIHFCWRMGNVRKGAGFE